MEHDFAIDAISKRFKSNYKKSKHIFQVSWISPRHLCKSTANLTDMIQKHAPFPGSGRLPDIAAVSLRRFLNPSANDDSKVHWKDGLSETDESEGAGEEAAIVMDFVEQEAAVEEDGNDQDDGGENVLELPEEEQEANEEAEADLEIDEHECCDSESIYDDDDQDEMFDDSSSDEGDDDDGCHGRIRKAKYVWKSLAMMQVCVNSCPFTSVP